MSIGLKRAAQMLVWAVAVLVISVVVVLPRGAEAQGMDGASVAEAGQTSSKQDAYYAGALQQPPSEPATPLVVVGAGDSLWSISQKHLGPGATPAQIANETERIFAVNREKIGDDPNLIFAGQELLLPSVSEPVTSVPASTSGPLTTNAPAASEPATTSASVASEPGADESAADSGVRTTTAEPTFGQDERRLLGLGIIVLVFVLVGLMAWKLPLSRDTEEGAAAWTMPARHPNYYVSPLGEDPEEDYHDVPSTLVGKTFAIKHNFDHLEITGATGGSLSSTPLVRTSGPRRLPRRGWATGVHSPQVRRFLRRPPGSTRGRRASPRTKNPGDRGGQS